MVVCSATPPEEDLECAKPAHALAEGLGLPFDFVANVIGRLDDLAIYREGLDQAPGKVTVLVSREIGTSK
jgi:hypothetical protein